MSTELKLKKDQKILKEIKRTIMEVAKEIGIEIDKIILFGSRARGDYREDSDWDILVVTKRKLDKFRKKRFWSKLIRSLDHDVDLLIVSKSNFEKIKKFKGFIYYYIAKEGKLL